MTTDYLECLVVHHLLEFMTRGNFIDRPEAKRMRTHVRDCGDCRRLAIDADRTELGGRLHRVLA